MFVESYNKADIMKTENDWYTIDGCLLEFKTIEACKEWIDGINSNAITTEFREGKFVNKVVTNN
jgi:hypothetical protein